MRNIFGLLILASLVIAPLVAFYRTRVLRRRLLRASATPLIVTMADPIKKP